MGNFNINTFLEVNSFPASLELWEYITQECFTLRDTGISQRVINHWDKEGLLPGNSRIEGQWRRFSFTDYIWIKFVEELRTVGLALTVIKQVREELFNPLKGNDIAELYKEHPEILDQLPDDEFKQHIIELVKTTDWENTKSEPAFTSFHMLLINTITRKESLSVMVYPNGAWMVWSEEFSPKVEEELRETFRLNTHVSVNIMKLIKDFIKSDPDLEEVPKFKLFAEQELKLMETIRSGNYESIRIRFKNRKKKPLDIAKEIGLQIKLVDILMNNEYHDITIKDSKGEVMILYNPTSLKGSSRE